MNPDPQLPVTLYPSRTRATILLGLSALFTWGGVMLIRDGDPAGYFCASFFALGLPVFTIQLFPQASFLNLSSDGITVRNLFRTSIVSWRNVQEFGVMQTRLSRMVAWNYVPGYQGAKAARQAVRSFAGFEGALPNTYGMKACELAELLNRLRQQYS